MASFFAPCLQSQHLLRFQPVRVEVLAMAVSEQAIESTQQETRLFPPPTQFSAGARIKSRAEYDKLYRESIDQPEQFWGRMAEELHWFKKWDKVLDWNVPNAKW